MILATIKNGKDSLCVELPSSELYDHLGSIGVGGDIKIGGSEKVSVELEADDSAPISHIIIEHIDPADRLTDLNKLCERLDANWRVGEYNYSIRVLTENVVGTEDMLALFDEMDQAAKEEIEYHKKHDMDM